MMALAVVQGQVAIGQHDEGEVLAIDCPRCRGRDEDCERCQGGGEEMVTAEDFRKAAARMDVKDAIATYSAWKQHGILPAQGAYLDQARGFHEVVRLFDGELNRQRSSDEALRQARRTRG